MKCCCIIFVLICLLSCNVDGFVPKSVVDIASIKRSQIHSLPLRCTAADPNDSSEVSKYKNGYFKKRFQNQITKSKRSSGWLRTLSTKQGRNRRNNSPMSCVKTAIFFPVTPQIGIFGHACLFILATMIVNISKNIFFFSKDQTTSSEAVGILDRCPWPFIFFHDPRQGFKDKPTWIMFTYIALWRCFKYYIK